MKNSCEKCGFEYDLGTYIRCPRCNTPLIKPRGCENCKGCASFGICNIKKKGDAGE